jgi:hypothetical protein
VRLHAAQGFRGRVLDLDTGRHVPKVIWVDQEAGLLEACQVDDDGRALTDGEGNTLTYTARGRFRWEPAAGVAGKQAGVSVPLPRGGTTAQGAPACTLCRNPLTLPGDDLCIRCKAQDLRVNRLLAGLETLRGPAPGLDVRAGVIHPGCSHPGCNRPAVWGVGDEVTASPAPGQITLARGSYTHTAVVNYRRGATVARRYFCSWHWRPPLLLDVKGEVVEEQEHGFGVRPE